MSSIKKLVVLSLSVSQLHGFIQPPAFASRINHHRSFSTLQDVPAESETISISEDKEEINSISAPIKFTGPYPSIGLRFPELATQNQLSQNKTGISLDFVIDTAANANTINVQVATELGLEVVGEALPGVGTSGAISGGDTFMLGDAQLEGTSLDSFTFMQNLTASALPVASPTGAGLLSLAFLYCFEGGVEFHWGSQSIQDGMVKDSPCVTFHGEKDAELDEILSKMIRIPIDPIPVTQLPSVMLNINGIKVAALLDTGSPITVLNSQAAEQAGIETIEVPSEVEKSNNPFAAVAKRFKTAQATAQAAANGDLVMIAGPNGQPTSLLKSTSTAKIFLSGDSDDSVSFGDNNVYVGDIPGLAALNGIGVDSPPAALLGMDVLRQRPKMLLRARDHEVFF
jgi:hypothetical protein